MTNVHITVLIHDDWRDRYPLVVDRCRQAGMDVDRELDTLGTIAGSIEAAGLAALAAIEGVAAVEPERVNITQTPQPNAPDSKMGGC